MPLVEVFFVLILPCTVGRTGSGKSSLTLALLRCIYIEGSVYYDGVPTQSLNLDALRSNITLYPKSCVLSLFLCPWYMLKQFIFFQPELMSGTLRQNLDMFGQHDDAALNDALRAAGLSAL